MEAPLAIVRCAHFLSVMFLFGAGMFLAAFAPPDLRRRLSPGLRPAAIAASVIALFTAALWLALEAASMSGDWAGALDPDTLADVLTSTAFGAVWQGRLCILVLLVAALLAARRDRWLAPTLVAAVAVSSLGLIDHAAMQTGGVGVIHRVNDGVHLMVAAIWLGGLPPFLMCLNACRAGAAREDALTAIYRFSTIGHIVVIALVISGFVNIALITGHLPWPPTSPYRALLATKLGVVSAMIVMAVVNRYTLAPRMEESGGALAALRMISLIETGLGCVVVALVSLFGLLDPA